MDQNYRGRKFPEMNNKPQWAAWTFNFPVRQPLFSESFCNWMFALQLLIDIGRLYSILKEEMLIK